MLSNGGDGWAFENPPIGSDDVPQEVKIIGAEKSLCFATSYRSCSKQQTISLSSLGISTDIMDTYKPSIVFTDW